MESLATPEDVVARLGRELTEPEQGRVEALLTDASALVRGYTHRVFSMVEDDTVVLRPVGTLIRLPQRPVRSVASVVALGCDGRGDIPLTGWCFDGVDSVDLTGLGGVVLNLPESWHAGGRPDTYRVTYTHGSPEPPADVVAVVCAMALRTLTAPSPAEGMVGENIGQYSYQMQQGAGTSGAAVRLSRTDREALDRYRQTATTIQMRMR